MARWKRRHQSDPSSRYAHAASVATLEAAAEPASAPYAPNSLLDLQSALEEMAHLQTVAESAGPAPAVTAPPSENDAEPGAARWIQITAEIQALLDEEAPAESPLPEASLSASSRDAFELFTPHCPPRLAEAFRKLRGRLLEERVQWEAAGRALHSIAIVSPRRRSGRSATARNLAACLGAAPDTKVLLVDADVERPSLHRRLSLPRSPGLAEALGSGGGWRQYVQRVPDSGLHVLTIGGTAAGIDSFGDEAVCAFLERARAEFTWTILDAPSMETADGETLARLAGAALLVLHNEREYFDEAGAAVRRLAPSRLLGAVLNYSV